MSRNAKPIVARLEPSTRRWLEAAVLVASTEAHAEVTPEHLLAAALDDPGECAPWLEGSPREARFLRERVEREVQRLERFSGSRPVLGALLLDWLEDAWLTASLEFGAATIRPACLLLTLARQAGRYTTRGLPEIDQLRNADLVRCCERVGAPAEESRTSPGAGTVTPTLDRFTTNLTREAREGRLDPVLGRHAELRRVLDILGRRRKNNPVLVGEPGVGKTAVVEALALAIVRGEVPDFLRGVELLALDLGLLQAGAAARGEFEQRLFDVIREVKTTNGRTILFIDEAHLLVGAGNAAGGSDAANLLKPALARGELRTIAATTFAEFKRTFEKDAALERRFARIQVEPPDAAGAIAMLRGLRDTLESAHGVVIRDEAIVDAVHLSERYVQGKQLPDKAIELLDTAAARVRTSRGTRPEVLVSVEAEIEALRRAESAILRDLGADAGTLPTIRARLEEQRALSAELEGRWTREQSGEARASLDPMVSREVDRRQIAETVSTWTGIPVGQLSASKVDTALELEVALQQRIVGQDAALSAIGDALRLALAGLKPTDGPLAVLLFTGPSGVGKTETAHALADRIFGGERAMTTIRMTEYQEAHSISRLIGSPPGYIGYGEGGVLTEAVRRRPHSLVLLDECEKAHLDVMNLFYQVFDRGVLADGEGRTVDFRNTVLVLTSNLGSGAIERAVASGVREAESLTAAIRDELSRHFRPALLARMTVVPFLPMEEASLRGVVERRLEALRTRLQTQGFAATLEGSLVDEIVTASLKDGQGARSVDHTMRRSVLPGLARTALTTMRTATSTPAE